MSSSCFSVTVPRNHTHDHHSWKPAGGSSCFGPGKDRWCTPLPLMSLAEILALPTTPFPCSCSIPPPAFPSPPSAPLLHMFPSPFLCLGHRDVTSLIVGCVCPHPKSAP